MAAWFFAGMMLVYQIPVTLYILWVIPLLVIQTILTAGVVFIGSAAIVFFRDVRFGRTAVDPGLDVRLTRDLSNRSGSAGLPSVILCESMAGNHRWVSPRTGVWVKLRTYRPY